MFGRKWDAATSKSQGACFNFFVIVIIFLMVRLMGKNITEQKVSGKLLSMLSLNGNKTTGV